MFCVLASFVLLACHSEPTIGTLVHEDSARPRPRALEEPERDETLVAVDSSGVVRLVDAASLELRLGVRASEEEATVVDLSVHAEEGELRRLAIVSQAEEEAPSDVSVFPFTGDVFARPRVVRRFEGVLDVLALSDGALVFQLGEAREWSFVSAGEDRPRSKQCPMPTSVLAVEHHEGATHVIALARSADDTPILARGVIEEGQVARCEVTPLSDALSEAARAVRLDGVDLIVDAVAGELVVGRLGGPAPTPVGLPFGRVEAVIPLALGAERGLAVVGSEPSSVVVVWLKLEGDPLVSTAASEALGAHVEQVYVGLHRALAFAAGRLFVATSAGLEAFEVEPPPAATLRPVALPDVVRSLRGPLASAPALEGEETGQE